MSLLNVTMFLFTFIFSAFNEMDENHDGQISQVEFIEVCKMFCFNAITNYMILF